MIGLALAVAAGVVALVWLDWRATRAELLALLREHAAALRQTVAAAARTNQAAATVAEAQLAARMLDHARFLGELDRKEGLSARVLEDVATRSQLFRVSVVDAQGAVEGGTHGRGPGPGHGPGAGGGRGPGPRRGGRGPGALAEELLAGKDEAVTDIHASRWGFGERLAAGVRRRGGGAILVTVDASEVAALTQPASLRALLGDITRNTPDVAYTTLDVGTVRVAHGSLPPDLEGSPPPAPAAGSGERRLRVDGRPVLEFTGPVPLGEDRAGTLRLGLRLDKVQAAERRLRTRLAASVLAATLLVGLSFGVLRWRERYGELRVRHARAEEALRRRDRLAAMGELARSVAHEVRNPLNAIAMSVRRVRREFLDSPPASPEERQEMGDLLEVMEEETQRIDRTVQQFLDFARPPRLAPRPTALGPWLAALAESRRALAEAAGLTLVVQVAEAGTAEVDPDQLGQAVDNLVRNAIEATPPGGEVRLRARPETGGHAIEVADTGRGIESEVLPRIFDLYFTTRAQGTGVGLALAQQVVSAHGGAIEVDSVPGRGTCMTVRLPGRSAPDAEAAHA